MKMTKETDNAIISVTFSNFYVPVVTEIFYKRRGTIVVKKEPLLKYAMNATGLKHQLELKGYKQEREDIR